MRTLGKLKNIKYCLKLTKIAMHLKLDFVKKCLHAQAPRLERTSSNKYNIHR